jgi:iron complex outermembrane receptor protein
VKRRALAAILMTVATPAIAASADGRISFPGGTLGDAVAAIGAQAGVSIRVDDQSLWQRRAPPLNGRMTAAEALRKIAGGSNVAVARIGPQSWRLGARPVRAVMPAAPVPPLAPATASEQPIIVTASKRGTPLRSFQGAITILDGHDLTFGGAHGTAAILSRLATVASTHFGSGRNKLFIRGIADSSFTGPTQATVGQYVGDVRLTYNAPDPDLQLHDIASVEVLEGPQATLYGAGSLGGIIRIVRNAPQLETVAGSASLGVSATRHGAPGADGSGTINLPLGRHAALRVTGYAQTEGGYIDNPLRGKSNINRIGIAGGRAMLRLDASSNWTIDLGATVQTTHGDDSQYADRNGPPLTSSSRFAQGFNADYALGELVITGQWDRLKLVSSTGIARQQLAERYDASLPDGPDRLFTQNNHTLLITNETRLSRDMAEGLGWVAGTSLLFNRTTLTRALGPLDAPQSVVGVTNRIGEATLYGEASIDVLPGLTLTGGARFTHAWLSGSAENAAPVLVQSLVLARAQLTAGRSETRFMPSFAVSTTALPGLVLYARYQQGFRPGGLSIDNDFVRRFRTDRVETVEAGLRHGDPSHGRFDLSLTLAATRWRDIQADFVDAQGLPTTDNIGDGRIHSLSLAGGWRPTSELRLDIGFTINDSRVTAPAPAFAAFLSQRNSRIPNIAHIAARAGADYRTRLNDRLDLHINAMWQYVGSSRLGVGPVLGGTQGDYFDSALTARIGRPDIGVTLGITNLADTVGNRFAIGTPFGSLANDQTTPLRPRTLRLGLDARF